MSGQTSEVKWYGRKLKVQIKEVTDLALFEGAKFLADEVEAKAPRRSGRLAKSVYASSQAGSTYNGKLGDNKEKKTKPGQALVTASAPYKHLVEYGTSKMAAKPFIRPSLDAHGKRVGEVIAAKMRDELKDVE